MDSGLGGMDIARSLALAPSVSSTYAVTADIVGIADCKLALGGASFGAIQLSTAVTATGLVFYGSHNGVAADAGVIKDADGVAVTMTLGEGEWHEMPSALLSVPFLHVEANAGTATIRVFIKG